MASVGSEVSAFFPGVTRLGGQIVAALHLAAEPRSMEELANELGCSKSHIFANLRALEVAEIVERLRPKGRRHDAYRLRGPYPDVLLHAYLPRLRRVVQEMDANCTDARQKLGDATGPEATMLRARLDHHANQCALLAELVQALPPFATPTDLAALVATLSARRR
jgi:DNA-binding transcriptional regulator GbsR (MarR family)